MNELVLARGASVSLRLPEKAAPCLRFAADELRRCLSAALEATFDGPPDGPGFELRRDESEADRYAILVSPHAVVVRGRDDEAIRDGVFDFLENDVGFCWLYPGSGGEAVPQLDRLRLKEARRIAPESLPYRGLHICAGSYHYDPAVAEWMARLRCNRKLTHHTEVGVVGDDLARFGLAPDTAAHSFSFWIPDAEFFRSRPEFFSLVGGKRIRHADGGQLCVSNRELRDVFASRVRTWAQVHPTVALVGIPSNDGYGWCECDDCRALDRATEKGVADVSGRLWDFSIDVASRLADLLPGRLVSQTVYSNFRDVPRRALPPNMAVGYTVGGRCFKHSLRDEHCPRNRTHREQILRWREKCEHVYLYEYYLRSTWADLPFPVWRTAAEDMRWCRDAGIDGFLSEVAGVARDSWRGSHLAVRAALRAMADPAFEANRDLATYCRARYGPAGGAMRKFYAALEEALDALPGCFDCGDATALRTLLTPEAQQRCEAALADAGKAAGVGGSPFHLEQLDRERALFAKWRRIAVLQAEAPPLGPLVATAFPGWEKALTPGGGDAVPFTLRSYRVPPEDGASLLRVYADADSVYFACECFESDMANLRAKTTEHCNAVYGDDGIEIFTATGPDAEACKHFLANTNGCRAASDCDLPGKRWNWSWPCDWEARARRFDDRWTLVARIPRAAIGAEDEIYFTVVRNRHAGGRLEMSGFPHGGAFFDPTKYMPLRFGRIRT